MIGSFNHGSMANALPQAIGAQFAYPGRQVVAMCGDGGFAMIMGDILTVTQYDLPIKFVVFNNGALGMVKLEMEVGGLPDYQTDLKNPNFAKLAEAIGIMGVRIENPADVSSGIKKALQHSGPALIDVVTDPNALSMPSHVDRRKPWASAGHGKAGALRPHRRGGGHNRGQYSTCRRVVGVALDRYSKWFRRPLPTQSSSGFHHCRIATRAGGSVAIPRGGAGDDFSASANRLTRH